MASDPRKLAQSVVGRHTRSLALLAAETGLRFVTREVAEIVHAEVLSQFGGLEGILNAGGLESALARAAQIISHTNERRPGALAAGLAFSAIKNHPFVDGNKRTAFALLATFLEINQCEFEADEEDIVNIFTDLAAGTLSESEFSAWVVSYARAGTNAKK